MATKRYLRRMATAGKLLKRAQLSFELVGLEKEPYGRRYYAVHFIIQSRDKQAWQKFLMSVDCEYFAFNHNLCQVHGWYF